MLWAGQTCAEDDAKVLNVKGRPIRQGICIVRALLGLRRQLAEQRQKHGFRLRLDTHMVDGVHLVAIPKHHNLVL